MIFTKQTINVALIYIFIHERIDATGSGAWSCFSTTGRLYCTATNIFGWADYMAYAHMLYIHIVYVQTNK